MKLLVANTNGSVGCNSSHEMILDMIMTFMFPLWSIYLLCFIAKWSMKIPSLTATFGQTNWRRSGDRRQQRERPGPGKKLKRLRGTWATISPPKLPQSLRSVRWQSKRVELQMENYNIAQFLTSLRRSVPLTIKSKPSLNLRTSFEISVQERLISVSFGVKSFLH